MGDLPSVKMKKRANILIMMAIFIFAFFISVNLFKIMVIESDEYQQQANDNQFKSFIVPANRGSIYSSDNKILAQSATVFKISLDPSMFVKHDSAHREGLFACLKDALKISDKKINDAMDEKNSQYVFLAKQVEMAEKDKILEFVNKNNIKCIMIEEDTKRYYPQDSLASAVIGFTNYDGDGQYGIESMYDEYLSGVDGVTISAQDANGDQMPYRYSKLYDAKDGDSLYLTIDTMVQYYVEAALDATVDKFKAKERGCAIVMDVNTGAVLGMATAKGFDLNNKAVLPEEKQNEIAQLPKDKQAQAERDALEEMWKNKAVSTAYEPGSVFKVFTSSAALEEKVVSFDSTFTCNGYLEVQGDKIDCWCIGRGGHFRNGNRLNPLSFKDALSVSCNPAFMQIGMALGAEKFSHYVEAFGLKERTGIDLPYEVSGVVAPESILSQYTTTLARSAFGQNNIFSPIEMITGYAAVVNGGYLLKPYVVSKVTDLNQNIVLKNERTEKRRVISEDTSVLMREALQYVVESNPTGNVYIDGYRIGGKSGTSEKIDKYNKEKQQVAEARKKDPTLEIPDAVQQNIASYCCFAPADNPQIITLVMIDEPDQGMAVFGSQVAMPCAAEIMKNILPYLGFYPEYNENEEQYRNIEIPNVEHLSVEEAKAKIESEGFVVSVRGEGTNVVSQVPAFTSSMPAGRKVILYTTSDTEVKKVTMPSIENKTLEEVTALFEEKGLNLKVSGSIGKMANAVLQSVESGTELKEGSIVEVTFGTNDQTG